MTQSATRQVAAYRDPDIDPTMMLPHMAQQLVAAMAQAPVAVTVWDSQDCLAAFNPFAAQVYGDGVFLLQPGLTYRQLAARMQAAAPTPQSRRDCRRGHTDTPKEVALSNGRWLRVHCLCLPDGGSIDLGYDITEERARQADHRAREERLALALEAGGDGVYDIDFRADRVWLSPSWKALLGYADHELSSEYNTFKSRVHPEDWPGLLASSRAAELRHDRFWSYEYRLRHRDGSWRWVLARAIYLYRDDGHLLRCTGTMTDTTERKRLEAELRVAKEQAEYANRSKSDFLAHMSHELRTPLNAILGFSEVIRDGLVGATDEDRYRDYAGDIHTSGSHLLSLINDVLDLSKIEAGKFSVDAGPCRPDRLLLDTARLFRSMTERIGIDLRVEASDELPTLNIDERLIKQSLMNLLSNAVKFTPHGGMITLKADDLGGAIKLSVADTGCGIPPNLLQGIFEPFSSAANRSVSTTRGTGLGLPLVRRFIELHDGRVTIDSDRSGTTVALLFPPARVIDHWAFK